MSRENVDLWMAMKATADICCGQEEAWKAAQKAQEPKPTPEALITPRVIYL